PGRIAHAGWSTSRLAFHRRCGPASRRVLVTAGRRAVRLYRGGRGDREAGARGAGSLRATAVPGLRVPAPGWRVRSPRAPGVGDVRRAKSRARGRVRVVSG